MYLVDDGSGYLLDCVDWANREVHRLPREVAVKFMEPTPPSHLSNTSQVDCGSHGSLTGETLHWLKAMGVLHQQEILWNGVNMPNLPGSIIAEQAVARVDLRCP
mmetsp:Transcript_3715/g.5073  ORF Transcript_3715/g.5073 Transcript_3715/m.5073 type:complete len:104 (-) Transcript_3715:137-448(-)